jgi:hypothetical protein
MFDANSVGINYESIKNAIMSKTQAGEVYSATGGNSIIANVRKIALFPKLASAKTEKVLWSKVLWRYWEQ